MPSLRTPLMIEDATQHVASSPNFAKTHKAMLYALAHKDDNPQNVVREASAIAEGRAELPQDSLQRLRTAFSVLPDPFRTVPGGLRAWVTGRVDPYAGVASEVIAAVSRTWQPSRANWLLTDAPMAGDADRPIRKTLQALLGQRENPNLERIIRHDAFQGISRLDFDTTPEKLIDRLPENTRDIARELIQIDFSRVNEPSDIGKLLFDRIASSAQGSEQTFKSATKAFRDGGLGDKEIASLQQWSRDTAAFQAVGVFVLGSVLGKPEMARQFSAGMQVANLALQVGLMFSTGGIGALAGAATLMSGLGGMEGLFGGGAGGNAREAAATREMFEHLSRQIDTLRSEMHQRFDRLERMQETALSMLRDIATEIRQGRIDAARRHNELVTDIARLERYVRSSDLNAKLEVFQKDVDEIQFRFTSNAPPDPKEVTSILLSFLRYALLSSTHPVFLYNPNDPLATAAEKVGRIDLATSLLTEAGKVLDIPAAQSLNQNPVEWFRGVQGYVEAQIDFPHIRNRTVDDRAIDAFNDGLRMWGQLRELCMPENLSKAQAALLKTVPDFYTALQQSIHQIYGDGPSAPILGRLHQATFSHPFTSATLQPGQHPIFVSKAEGSIEKWQFVVADDRLDTAIGRGRVVRTHTGDGKDQWQENENNIIYGTEAEWKSYALRGKAGTTIANARYYEVPVYGPIVRGAPIMLPGGGSIQNPLGEKKVQGKFIAIRVEDMPLEKFMDNITDELDDTGKILEWVGNLDNLEGNRHIRAYLDAVAAFLLITTTMNWVATGQLDDPWRGAVASRLPRSIEDIKNILKELAVGVRPKSEWLLKPIGNSAREINDFMIIEAKLMHFASERRTSDPVSWQDLKVHPEFIHMAPRVIHHWIGDGVRYSNLIAPKLPCLGSLGIIDEGMARLNGWLTDRVGIP